MVTSVFIGVLSKQTIHAGAKCGTILEIFPVLLLKYFNQCCIDHGATFLETLGGEFLYAAPILCHQLRSVVVGIIDENIGKRHSLFAPIDEGIDLMLGVEKQFEHRDE